MNTDDTNGLTYPTGHVPVTVPPRTAQRLLPEHRLSQRLKRLSRFGFDNPDVTHWLSLYAQQQSTN